MAEEIGRRIAQELSDSFARIGLEILARQSSLHFGAQTLASLRRSIAGELRGFNEVAPSGFHLHMLSGQSCLVFSFESKLALTLKVESALVRLVPAPSKLGEPACDEEPAGKGRDCSDFVVTQDDSGYHFKQMPLHASSEYTPVLTESEFIDGVIRVACGQPFERH